MDCRMPGFSVLHYLLEFAQTHVHWVDDAIQPSHPLSPHSVYLRSIGHLKFGLQGDQTNQTQRKSTPEYSLEGLMLKLQTLVTWCKEPTPWKRPWCWERLKTKEEGSRGWDGWMASPTQWTWVWANSRRWWRTGKPGMWESMGSQRVGHKWVTEQEQILYK